MSADRNSRAKYPGRWGSSGPHGERDDKGQPQSSSSSSYHSRYRLPSGSSYHSSQQNNRGSRQSYDSGESSSYSEGYTDSYRPSKRPYNTNNNTLARSTYAPRTSDSYPSSTKPFRDYPPSGRGRGSYFQSSRYGGSNLYKSNSYHANNNSSRYYERRTQRYNDKGNFRTNPEETSDHYYPQRDRRSSLINSNPTSSPAFTNKVETTKHNDDLNDRSISPLNSDTYSDNAKVNDGYERKSKPSLIPCNFKDDEQDDEEDDYELDVSYKNSASSASIRHDQHNKSDEMNETDILKDASNGLQERIAEQLPLTLEHKEELDEANNEETTRESSEESSYDPIQTLRNDTQTALEDKIPNQGDDEQQGKLEENHEQAVENKIESGEFAKDEESDSYEPDLALETGSTSTELLSTVPINPTSSKVPIELPKEKEEPEIQSSTETETQIEEPNVEKKIQKAKKRIMVPLQDVEGFIFPMDKVEQRVWELKNHPKEDVLEASPHLLKRPIRNFEDYPFYQRNLLVHEQGFKLKLMEKLSVLKGSTFDHKISLWNEYSHRTDDWNQRCSNMEEQLRSLYPVDEHATEEQQQQKYQEQEPEPSQSSTSTRRGRYHGDTVRSEAEFLEILKNLEKEKESDPLYRAEQLAAKIPDMILNPAEKSLRHLDVNNLVLDKEEWAARVESDPIDTFTKHEHEMFCEAFLAFPKRFGRISAAMGGLRTAEECVLHYYKTKKSLTDYKQLVASKKKRNRKGKANRRISKSKNGTATNTSAPNTPSVETPGESAGEEKELGLENFIPKEAVAEELYTETGRRRRAAAPVFDSTKGPKANGESEVKENEERKRSLEPVATTNDIQDDDSENKGSSKKKPKGQKVKKKEEVRPDTISEPFDDRNGGRAITSYWSVKDINQFVSLIGEYGTQWSLISGMMKTKSTTMVRNYFMKHAENNGWKPLAESVDYKNRAYALTAQPHQQLQQQQQQNEFQQPILKKPPLGVFSSHGDLPSNVNIPNYVKHEQSTLPSVQSLPGFSNPSASLPPPQSVSYQHQHPSLPPLPSVAPTLAGGYTSRTNPFSITSLLNPSEEFKSSPPAPAAISASSNQGYLEGRNTHASYSAPPNGRNPTVMNMLNNNDEQKPFNPLSTLIAAADDSSRSDSWSRQNDPPTSTTNGPAPSYGGFTPYGYTNSNDTITNGYPSDRTVHKYAADYTLGYRPDGPREIGEQRGWVGTTVAIPLQYSRPEDRETHDANINGHDSEYRRTS